MKSLLWLDNRVLTPRLDGGSLRAFELLGILQDLVGSVFFTPVFPASFPPFQEDLETDEARLKAQGITLVHDLETLEQYAFGTVVVSTPSAGVRFLELCRKKYPEATLIYDTVELHHVRYYREARNSSNQPHAARALRMKNLERHLCRAADRVWVVSETEREIVAGHFGVDPGRVDIIPNVHEETSPKEDSPFESRRDLVFVGSFMHPPNEAAITRFAAEIFPEVAARLEGARLHIVGPYPPDSVRALASDNVEVHGFVDDLKSFLLERRLNIAPLLAGAGIKGKILFALGCGLPTVTTCIGAEGLVDKSSSGILVCDTHQEWVDGLTRCYTQPELWASMRTAGKKLIRERFSRDVVSGRLQACLKSISESRPTSPRDR